MSTLWFVVGLMDAVHKAAFRGTLSRSLFMNPDRVGSYSTKAVSGLLSDCSAYSLAVFRAILLVLC